jgi:hypothetical protein
MNYSVEIRGGLGDVLFRYLQPWSDSGMVPALRKTEPDAIVQLLVMSTAPAASELFSECKLFDQIIFADWDGDPAAFERRNIAGHRRVYREGFGWERPTIGLTVGERTTAEAIGAQPFIAVHPFAGTPDRDWRGKVDVGAILSGLASLGLGVVVLGGSSTRTEGRRGTTRKVDLVESLDRDARGIVNLVGRSSVRLQAELACRAACFVGSFSAYHCAAMAMGVPSFVVAGRELAPFFSTTHPVYGRIDSRPRSRVGYFDQPTAAIVEFARRAVAGRVAA